jgi:hypothetical protein
MGCAGRPKRSNEAVCRPLTFAQSEARGRAGAHDRIGRSAGAQADESYGDICQRNQERREIPGTRRRHCDPHENLMPTAGSPPRSGARGGHVPLPTCVCVYDFIDDPLGLFKDDPDRFTPTADEARALARPRTLGGSYLFEALDAIRDAGSSDMLYTSAVRAAAGRAREPGWVLTAQHDAAEQRIRFSRNAMLFAAFAAEAYINEFIAAHFTGKDYEAVEKLSTVDKYVLAPRTALGRDLFPRDREPAQTLRALFKQRDVLVHPKPEKGLPGTIRAAGYPRVVGADPIYNPRAAVTVVLAVAEAADTIVREGNLGNGFDAHAFVIVRGRAALERYARAATEALPAPDAAPRTVPLIPGEPIVRASLAGS